jgi:hypothetical protein
MKRRFSLLLSAALLLVFIAPQAWAGSPQKHRWEGVGIGIGAAVLGGMLLNHTFGPGHHAHYDSPRQTRAYSPFRQCAPYRGPVSSGHWEIRKEWVAPVCEKVWNPGHYNRRQRWIPGKWITIERQPGYWREDKVWVPY